METVKHSSIALAAGQTSGSTTAVGSVTSATTRERFDWRTLLATVVVALAVWLPRGFELDHFVTTDEPKWLMRSANYYQALTYGNLIDTYQQGHPGVIIMYAGLAGYLWKFPDYVEQVDVQHKDGDPFMAMLVDMGHQPIDLLAAGRTFIVFFNVVALTLAFLYARRLVGLWPALVSFLLIAFDPFHIALSRFLHPDSLLSTLMLVATLAFMAYLFAGRRIGDLIAAGVYTALAWLTKTPAIFLIPLVGLLTVIELAVSVTNETGWRWGDFVKRVALWRLLRVWLIWGGVALVIYFALWPALWVDPAWTLSRVFSISGAYATEGHDSSVFFNGQIYNGDPGFWFYPINYLWRTTPVVMVGLVLLVGTFIWGGALTRRRTITLTLLGLFAFAFFFGIFMTLGAKKFDRYLLPAFLSLDFAAALGWVAVLVGLATWRRVAWGRYAAAGVAIGAIGLQAGLALNTYPYYMSYYNPVMGGATKAEEVMFIGWGEGLDDAARYLNELPDAETTTVSSWYHRGPFSFIYNGITLSSSYTWESDYAAIYNHQWQREQPNRRMLAYFDTLTPVHTIHEDGIEYVKIYNMQETPPSDYTVAWGDAINLMYYETPTGVIHPGQLLEMVIYFLKSAPIDVDYKIKLRIVSQEGHTLLLQESKPRQVNTSDWKVGEVLIDDTYVMEVPEETPSGLYRIEISFYDPNTLDHLPAVQINNGQALNDPYVLDYLVIGDWPPASQIKLEPPVILGDEVALEGAAMLDATGKEQVLAGKSFAPGDSIPIRLHWRAQKFIHSNYTNFVHVVGPDGSIIAQADRLPLDGFIPTSYWPPQQVMGDNYIIELPNDAPNGEYQLLVGWYQLETLTRLPMSQANKAIGDAYPMATFTVR